MTNKAAAANVRSFPHRVAWAAVIGGAGLAVSCVLPSLSLDGRPCPCTTGYTCDTATNVCVRTGGATGSGGGSTSAVTGSTTTVTGSTTTGSTTTGTGGSAPMPAKPLVLESNTSDGTLSLSVKSAFRIQSTATSNWQWSQWTDLANGSPDNLASTLPAAESQATAILLNPGWLTTDYNDWCDGEHATLVSVNVQDQTPVRVIVDTVLNYTLPGIKRESVQTLYASGRIAIRTITTNTLATDRTLVADEYDYISVNPNLTGGPSSWAKTSYLGLAAGFLRTDGAMPKSSLLALNTVADNHLQFDAMNTNWYWGDSGNVVIAAGKSYEYDGELQLGPDDQTGATHVLRASDVLAGSTGLTVMSGATPIGNGYDVQYGTYSMQAMQGANQVVFGPTSDVDRFSPVFTIEGFSHPSYRITLNGQEVTSSAQPIGIGALSYYDTADTRVVFTAIGQFAQGAPPESRVFTLEGL